MAATGELTHMANAFGENVYLKLSREKITIPAEGGDFDKQKFLLIEPQNVTSILPPGKSDEVTKCFVSVCTESGTWLCKNLLRFKDQSLIIDKEGTILDQKAGASPWQDLSGKEH